MSSSSSRWRRSSAWIASKTWGSLSRRVSMDGSPPRSMIDPCHESVRWGPAPAIDQALRGRGRLDAGERLDARGTPAGLGEGNRPRRGGEELEPAPAEGLAPPD